MIGGANMLGRIKNILNRGKGKLSKDTGKQLLEELGTFIRTEDDRKVLASLGDKPFPGLYDDDNDDPLNTLEGLIKYGESIEEGRLQDTLMPPPPPPVVMSPKPVNIMEGLDPSILMPQKQSAIDMIADKANDIFSLTLDEADNIASNTQFLLTMPNMVKSARRQGGDTAKSIKTLIEQQVTQLTNAIELFQELANDKLKYMEELIEDNKGKLSIQERVYAAELHDQLSLLVNNKLDDGFDAFHVRHEFDIDHAFEGREGETNFGAGDGVSILAGLTQFVAEIAVFEKSFSEMLKEELGGQSTYKGKAQHAAEVMLERLKALDEKGFPEHTQTKFVVSKSSKVEDYEAVVRIAEAYKVRAEYPHEKRANKKFVNTLKTIDTMLSADRRIDSIIADPNTTIIEKVAATENR